MYTINIRGKQNPKDKKIVKLEMIFFKTGYARVPKVLNINWLSDEKLSILRVCKTLPTYNICLFLI